MAKIVIEITSIIEPNISKTLDSITTSALNATNQVSALSKSLEEIGTKSFTKILDVIKQSSKAYSDNAIAIDKTTISNNKAQISIQNKYIQEEKNLLQIDRIIEQQRKLQLSIEKTTEAIEKSRLARLKNIDLTASTIDYTGASSGSQPKQIPREQFQQINSFLKEQDELRKKTLFTEQRITEEYKKAGDVFSKSLLLRQRLADNQAEKDLALSKLSPATRNANNAASKLKDLGGLNTGLSPTSGNSVALEAQILKANLDKLPPTIDHTSHSMLNLHNIFLAFLAIKIAKNIFDLADAYTLIGNRLQLVSSSTSQAVALQKEMFEIANSSRVSVSALTSSFVRFDYALKTLGATQSESARFTRTLSEQLSLGGLTTEEQSSALLQLSQALNKGKLDGDEFRTVMETLPTLATAIAEQMGVARGELIKLAPQGKITATVIREAVKSIALETDKAFQKLSPTIGQALTVASNKTIELMGHFNEITGASKVLADSILFLSNNMYLLGEAAIFVSVVLLQRFTPSVVLSASAISKSMEAIKISTRDALTSITSYIAANPVLISGIAVYLATTTALTIATERYNTAAYIQDQMNEKQRINFEENQNAKKKNIILLADETEETKKLNKETTDYLNILISNRNLLAGGLITSSQASSREKDSLFGKRISDIQKLTDTSKSDELKNNKELQDDKEKQLIESFANQLSDAEKYMASYDKIFIDSNKKEKELNSQLQRAKLTEIENYNQRVRDAREVAIQEQKKDAVDQARNRLGLIQYILSDEQAVGLAKIKIEPKPINTSGVLINNTRSDAIQKEIEKTKELGEVGRQESDKEKENIRKINEALEEKIRLLKRQSVDKIKFGITNEEINDQYEYNNTLQATNELVFAGRINHQAQQNILKETSKIKKEIALNDRIYNETFHTEGDAKIRQIEKERDATLGLLRAKIKYNSKDGAGSLEETNVINESTRRTDEIKRQEAEKARFGFNKNGIKNSPTDIEGTRQNQIEEQNRIAKDAIAFALEHNGDLEQIDKDHHKKLDEIDREAAEKRMDLAANTFGALAGLAKQFADSGGRAGHIAFEAYRAFSLAEATVSMASAISKANASAEFPYNIPAITIAAATGAAQISAIVSANIGGGSGKSTSKGYAKGVVNIDGEGTATSDSILARVSKGESVITAAATRTYGNELRYMNENPNGTSSSNNTYTNIGNSGNSKPIFNIYNNNGSKVEAKQSASGNPNEYDIHIDNIEAKLAQRYSEGTGKFAKAIDGKRNRGY